MPLTVRPATIADSKSVYDWRNDPVTVSTSRTQAGVEWVGHSAWFPAQLANPEKHLPDCRTFSSALRRCLVQEEPLRRLRNFD
jgi:hypothetical protein